MTDNVIVRVAAKGDGVTSDGRHIAGTAPGDRILPDGRIEPGEHRQRPPCRHFAKCGGCQLQHLDDEAVRQFVTDRVVHAAAGQGLEPITLLPTHLSPPSSRLRATLHAQAIGKRVVLGYREERSHRIVDIRECPVLRPELFRLFGPLRDLLSRYSPRGSIDVGMTLTDQGPDIQLSGIEPDGLDAIEALTRFAMDNNLARLTLDQGFGAETFYEPQPVTVTWNNIPVSFPAGAFLQATQDGAERLIADTRVGVANAESVADFFSGLGMLAFGVAEGRSVAAFEAARDAHLACRQAAATGALHVEAHHRDLFRNPLQPDELSRFDAVILDPPRAGAREQIASVAKSEVPRVVYVSCNPSSWARDAQTLCEAGFRLETLRPVGQFRWATHVELTSVFTRG
ncbi:class I SAM-dependent RNA methyltransferase [Qipengyuania atrilutea]|uniref:Class I SAM-dependent RNA methyltransferase n=1 Tax=Qipengyuania atrilutea TaxID=2744473 RepID=A0A850H089_9SPHN|nr:class I SAM-dependent RNA methyltransferase [Actirhodobacter atriluteus]NVD43920.1 class I SAM-dependent RNA methyltransferase [Actirhodobacter atriluteus]